MYEFLLRLGQYSFSSYALLNYWLWWFIILKNLTSELIKSRSGRFKIRMRRDFCERVCCVVINEHIQNLRVVLRMTINFRLMSLSRRLHFQGWRAWFRKQNVPYKKTWHLLTPALRIDSAALYIQYILKHLEQPTAGFRENRGGQRQICIRFGVKLAHSARP